MIRAYLERHDNDKNMHRFYQMHVAPGLFDDWSLIREWGRIGSPGTVRKDWFETEKRLSNHFFTLAPSWLIHKWRLFKIFWLSRI